jgi:hypothetical protein
VGLGNRYESSVGQVQSMTVWCHHCSMFSRSVLTEPLIFLYKLGKGARGSVVGRGTMLQAGRLRVRFPMESLDFSVDPVLTVVPGILLGVKGGRRVRLTSPLSESSSFLGESTASVFIVEDNCCCEDGNIGKPVPDYTESHSTR